MQLHFIHHSCFAAEEDDCLMVFDYWQDPGGRLAALLEAAAGKTVYFIVSHFHQDHFNADIPGWCASHPDWHLLPSYDTVRRRRIDKSLPLAVLRFGESVETPHFHLDAYRSTDVGVSTVLTLRDGTTLFHAGDCNNWRFPPDIKRDHPHIDHAMFPVDPRLGQEMLRGPLQLLRAIDIVHLHPMHYSWGLTADI